MAASGLSAAWRTAGVLASPQRWLRKQLTCNDADILAARILVVDDMEANVLLLEQMLRGAGYACVMSTTDPHTECDLHCLHCFDLILLDLQMPGHDGFQVMDGLNDVEADSYLPVIVITAQPDHRTSSASRSISPKC